MANSAKVTAPEGTQEIWIEREFDAPRDLLFKAATTPELVEKWWGDNTKVDHMDVRNGGSWRYTYDSADKGKGGFHGSYHEVSPELTIETFEWEGMPEKGHVLLQTTRMEELEGGRTLLKVQQVFQSVADRDGMLQSGMKDGMEDSYQRLDKLLSEIKG